MKKVEIILTLKKSTKGTHVYGNDDSAIPSVYIQKHVFDGQPPQQIVITIEEKK